jgi:hypothetical protein
MLYKDKLESLIILGLKSTFNNNFKRSHEQHDDAPTHHDCIIFVKVMRW